MSWVGVTEVPEWWEREFAVLLHLLFITQQNVTNILFFWKLSIIHGVTVVISEIMQ